MQWVELLPDTQTPSWLGLPNNAERVLLTTQGECPRLAPWPPADPPVPTPLPGSAKKVCPRLYLLCSYAQRWARGLMFCRRAVVLRSEITWAS